MMEAASRSEYAVARPAVSVILPTFNRLHYLRQAVQSVFDQTLADWELVIADDGSEPETIAYLDALARRGNVQLLKLTHTGNPSAVRNAALRVARGDFVAFLDSDDLWLPRKLEIQVGGLRADRTRRWSYTALRRIGPDGSVMAGDADRTWIPYDGSIFEQLLTLEAGVATPTVVAERTLLEEAGGFDEGQLYFEEYDLWLRLIRRSEVVVIPEPLACVRSHDEHYTQDRVAVYEARSRLLDKVSAVGAAASLGNALRRERARNAIWLARAYALRNLRAAALETLWRSRVLIWQGRGWSLRPASASLAYAVTPGWVRALARHCRRLSGAAASGWMGRS